MKLRNRYILLNVSVSFVLVTLFRLGGLDRFMVENMPFDLLFLVYPFVSLVISLYGIWKVKELKNLDPNERRMYVIISFIISFVFSPFISELIMLPLFWVYCQNNIC